MGRSIKKGPFVQMMRLYEQGSSHRLKALGFRPNYVGGIFYEYYAF